MALVKKVRALIDVLDGEEKISGHELETWVTYEPEGQNDPLAGAVPARMVREPATQEDMAKFRKESDEKLTDSCKALSAQIADLQEQLRAKAAQMESGLQAAGTLVQEAQKKQAEAESALAAINGRLLAAVKALQGT